MRPQIAAANWKMNLTLTQAEALLDALLAQSFDAAPHRSVLLAVPFPYLPMVLARTPAVQASRSQPRTATTRPRVPTPAKCRPPCWHPSA